MKKITSILLNTLVLGTLTLTIPSCKDEAPPIPDSFKPTKISLDDLDTTYQGQTVLFDSVFFDPPPGTKLNGTASNANGGKTIKDCYGNSAIVHTSPQHPLSDYYIPTGMGPLTAFVDVYQEQIQLVLREYSDISSMTEEKCTTTEKINLVTIPEIQAGNYESGIIIKIDSVEYENTSNVMSDQNNITDCDGNLLKSFVYSSDPLGSESVPAGNGPIYGELELYNGVWEIKPRNADDIAEMTGSRCTAVLGSDTTVVTISQVQAGSYASGTFVKIDSVQFQDTTAIYNDSPAPKIEDCSGNTLKVFVFNSNTALADKVVMSGRGPIYGEIELYNGVWEIKPETMDDVDEMTGTRCP